MSFDPGLGLTTKGDSVVCLGSGQLGRLPAPLDGSVHIADSTQPTGYSALAIPGSGNGLRAVGVKGTTYTISVPSRGLDDADGVGIAITSDVGGSGGSGNHLGEQAQAREPQAV
jgi:hypothetical protein